MKIVALKKEVAAKKAAAVEKESGAVLKIKLQHQTKLNTIRFQLKYL